LFLSAGFVVCAVTGWCGRLGRVFKADKVDIGDEGDARLFAPVTENEPQDVLAGRVIRSGHGSLQKDL
jgi:hypothetical protein